jgi:hypothetical protein
MWLGFLLLTNVACVHFVPKEWSGTVLDASTGQELSGATVSVVWTSTTLMEGGPGDFLGAAETVTNATGKFELATSPPYRLVVGSDRGGPPSALITKPGYSVGDGIRKTGRLWEFETQVSIYPCSSIHTSRAPGGEPKRAFGYMRFCDPAENHLCVPADAVPLLVRSISDETRAVCREKP